MPSLFALSFQDFLSSLDDQIFSDSALQAVDRFLPHGQIHGAIYTHSDTSALAIDLWEGMSGASADPPKAGLKNHSVSNAREKFKTSSGRTTMRPR